MPTFFLWAGFSSSVELSMKIVNNLRARVSLNYISQTPENYCIDKLYFGAEQNVYHLLVDTAFVVHVKLKQKSGLRL